MLTEGTFPNIGDLAMSRSSPRVGDGFIRLDVDGVVVFASPNALSAYHRMGSPRSWRATTWSPSPAR